MSEPALKNASTDVNSWPTEDDDGDFTVPGDDIREPEPGLPLVRVRE